MKRTTAFIVALLTCTFVASVFFAGVAEAQGKARQIIPPSTRPMFFTVGIGPSFWALNDRRVGRFGLRRGHYERAKLAFDFGYHFSGDGEGPAIGAAVEQTFSGNFYSFNPAFKFWYDIEIADLGIYVTPLAKAGYALQTCDGCGFIYRNRTEHAFNLAVGVEGRVVFKDRWMVYLRPVHLDTYMGAFYGQTFLLNYDVLLGGGVTF